MHIVRRASPGDLSYSCHSEMPDVGIFRSAITWVPALSHAFLLSSYYHHRLTLLITKVSHFAMIASSSSSSKIEIRE